MGTRKGGGEYGDEKGRRRMRMMTRSRMGGEWGEKEEAGGRKKKCRE
jgi:hypothetical protein